MVNPKEFGADSEYQDNGPGHIYPAGDNMSTDTEIKMKGVHILAQHLGDVDAKRFIALIQREPFDYTKWRQGWEDTRSVADVSREAMALQRKRDGR